MENDKEMTWAQLCGVVMTIMWFLGTWHAFVAHGVAHGLACVFLFLPGDYYGIEMWFPH